MLKENNKEVRTSVANINIRLDPGFWTKTSQIQLFYGVWVNLCHLGIGLAYGLPSVQVPQLFAADSDIKITRSEGSWIASVFTLCSPIGCLISGYVADWLGRRVMIIVCQAPICAGWLYTGFAKSPKQVIIGRALTGFGCGLAMGPPRIYCTEMSLPNMRGVIGAFSTVGVSIGITVQAGLGKYLNWPILCYICSVYTVIVFVLFLFLPETPYFVLKTKTLADARATLAHFRARDYDLDKEMDQLRKFKEGNDIRKISGRERLAMLFTQSAYKPFSVIVTYIFISQITGTSGVMIWAVEMLTVAKSSVDVNTGNFLMTLTRLFVNILTSILLFKVGRKPLAQTSAVGVAVTSMVIAIYTSTHTEPSMPPQILFMSYMAFASVGYYVLPFLMASEIYPLQVRGILAGLTVFVAGLLISGSIKLTPTLLDSIGLSYTMVIFGFCSLLGVIYIYFVLPETKNLTLQEIEEYYNKRRPTLTSQRRLETIADLEAQSKTNIKLVERKST